MFSAEGATEGRLHGIADPRREMGDEHHAPPFLRAFTAKRLFESNT
jgi:hypothetical protein